MKRKFKILLFLSLLHTFFLNVSGQGFNIRSRYDMLSGAWYSAFFFHDTLYIHGVAAHGFSNSYTVQLKFLKETAAGIFNPLFQYQPDTIHDFYPDPVLISKAGKIIVSGGYGIRYPSNTCFFMKCDSSFTPEKISSFHDSLKRTNVFVETIESDNNFLCLNVFQKTTENIKADIALYKLDQNGDTIWVKEYVQPGGYSLIAQKVAAYKSGYLIAGEYHDYITHSYSQAPKLIYTDTGGIVQWQKLLDDSIDGIHDWVINPDNSIIYCSKWGDSIEQSGYIGWRGYLAKIDSNQNKVWDMRIDPTTIGTELNAITSLRDGNYIAGGLVPQLSPDTAATGGVIKFHDAGDSVEIIWKRCYRPLTPKYPVNYIYDILERRNGSIIACGKSECPDDTFPQQGWILGLDSFGCLVPGCQNWNGIDEAKTSLPVLRLYPNPVSNQLYFDVRGITSQDEWQISVADVTGKILASIPHVDISTEYFLDTKGYVTGLYFLTLSNQRDIHLTKQFMKE